ncbi:MAG: hypothetical protein ACI4EN_08245 [Butyrivibrio sp.]
MILWEIRKIIRSKFFIISLMLILALYAFNIVTSVPDDIGSIASENEFFDELLLNEEEYDNYALPYYEGLDEKGIFQIMNIDGVYLDNAYEDYFVIGELKDKKQYVTSGYEKAMINVVTSSAVSMGRSNSYFEKKYYEKSIKTYNVRIDVKEVNEKGMERYLTWLLNEPIVGMVLMLWCVVLTTQVIGFEERKNLKIIVAATKRGRRELLLSKIAAIAVIIAVLKLLSIAVNIVIGMMVHGISFRTLMAPVQSLEEYRMCCFHISILGFFIMVGIGQLILLELVVCVTAVMAYFTKAVPAAGISLVLWEAPAFILARQTYETYLEMENFERIRQYAPWALNCSRDYFVGFDYGKFVNFPVNRFIMCIAVCLVVITACMALCIFFADKNNLGVPYGTEGRKCK